MRRRLTIIVALVGSCLALWGSCRCSRPRRPRLRTREEDRADPGQGRVPRGKEKVLTRDISRYTDKDRRAPGPHLQALGPRAGDQHGPHRQAFRCSSAPRPTCAASARAWCDCSVACARCAPHCRRGSSSSTRTAVPILPAWCWRANGFANLIEARASTSAGWPPGPADHRHRRQCEGRCDDDRASPRLAGEAPAGRRRGDHGAAQRRRARARRRDLQPDGAPRRAQREALAALVGEGLTQGARRGPLPDAGAAGEDQRHPLRLGVGRAGQARQRSVRLAGEWSDHRAVLRAAGLGELPPGHRHRRAGRARRSMRRTRVASPSPAGSAATATTSAFSTPRRCRRVYGHNSKLLVSVGQTVARARSSPPPQHRALDRSARALRGARQRRGHQPDELPVARPR